MNQNTMKICPYYPKDKTDSTFLAKALKREVRMNSVVFVLLLNLLLIPSCCVTV